MLLPLYTTVVKAMIELSILIQTGVAPTMFWVYAATALLVVLFGLLTAPYFGIFGEKDINIETDPTENPDKS